MTEIPMAEAGQFRKYDHLERLKHPDVNDISFGVVHIFPKIDGTNSSVWIGDDGVVRAGSRTRTLSIEHDNAGFFAWVLGDSPEALALRIFLLQFPMLQVYIEWLIPHSLRTYREEAWRRAYVLDVYSHERHRYVPYEEYGPNMIGMGIDVIAPLAIIENPSDNQLAGLRDIKNTYLIKDDCGVGEGIVLKNYAWTNKYGRQPWGKMVRNEFKETNALVFGMKPTAGEKMVEQEIVTALCTPEFIRKTYSKVVNAVASDLKVRVILDDMTEEGGEMRWSSFCEEQRHRIIPRFIGTVFLEFVEEEIRQILKKFKNPVIDFSKLQKLITIAAKTTMKEVF